MSENHNIPPAIAKAICDVMSGMTKLEKRDKNPHGGFMFTSIDDFLQTVGPLCAKSGLIIIQDEEDVEVIPRTNDKGQDASWLRCNFSFTLAHSSGETWAYRPKRTAFVAAKMGPQATGAAQSYALKQFERSLFHIATGDKEDADTHPAADLPAKEPVFGKLTKTKLQAQMREFDTDLHAVEDIDSLEGLLKSYKDALDQCERDLRSWYYTKQGSETLGIQDRIIARRKELEQIALNGPPAATEAATATTKLQRTIEASLRACISVENLDAFKASQDGIDQDAYLRPIYENLRAILVEKENQSGKPEDAPDPAMFP